MHDAVRFALTRGRPCFATVVALLGLSVWGAAGCGSRPALDRLTVQTRFGLRALQVHYEEGRAVGTTVTSSFAPELNQAMTLDGQGRLLNVGGDGWEQTTVYEGDTAVRTSGSSETVYLFDGDRIVGAHSQANFRMYDFRAGYDGGAAEFSESGFLGERGSVTNTVVARKGGDCGSAVLSQTPVPVQVTFACGGENSLLNIEPGQVEVLIHRGEHGQIQDLEVREGGRPTQVWALKWFDDGRVGPRVQWGEAFAAGRHIDGAGKFHLGPRLLDLDLGSLVLGAGLR